MKTEEAEIIAAPHLGREWLAVHGGDKWGVVITPLPQHEQGIRNEGAASSLEQLRTLQGQVWGLF